MQVDITEAAVRLDELLAAAERGEDVTIERSGAAVVRLVPVHATFPPVALGSLAGEIDLGDDFDAPLDDAAPYR